MHAVHAPSRLHFGLLSISGTEQRPRHFGGVGLMIDRPGVHLKVSRSPEWSAEGPLAGRALAFGRQFAASAFPGVDCCFHVAVESCAGEHQGLGTGTQLGLAVARGISVCMHASDFAAPTLARHIGRGARSALGIHGFERGGFLIDGGKSDPATIAPLIFRRDFPEDWHLVLVLPGNAHGLHGISEDQAFARLDSAELHSDALCRLVLLGVLPALVERDLKAFGDALYEFNRRVGEMFRRVQGGIYAHPRGQDVVKFVRDQGITAAGQSSWGPALFAITPEDRAQHLAGLIRDHFGYHADEVLVVKADNRGALTQNRCA